MAVGIRKNNKGEAPILVASPLFFKKILRGPTMSDFGFMMSESPLFANQQVFLPPLSIRAQQG